jgi:class 3 adenylate cyclase
MSKEVFNILVVDDNEMNRDVLARRLQKLGLGVDMAVNGLEALEKVRQKPFDLVLLDIMMPEMNGYEVLQTMKTDLGLRHIPVIMISAIDEIDSIVRCIDLGAEDYLTTPFNPTLLKARVGACLEKKSFRDQEQEYLAAIEKERSRYEDLLQLILPIDIVRELKETNAVQPRRYENVAIMFADIVGFTAFCQTHDPEVVVERLQYVIETLEEIGHRHGLEKIKTIGDAFMAASGLLQKTETPVLDCVRAALEMHQAMEDIVGEWKLRIGIHIGPVLAGIIGRRKYLFDVWGDTVNTASRVESHGVPGSVNLSEAAANLVRTACDLESRGFVLVKGKGEMEMFLVSRLRDEAKPVAGGTLTPA